MARRVTLDRRPRRDHSLTSVLVSESSPLKLLIDRLVCADVGNPDPTSTSGEMAGKAKELGMAGWDYPPHLAGRAYGLAYSTVAPGNWLLVLQRRASAGYNAEKSSLRRHSEAHRKSMVLSCCAATETARVSALPAKVATI